MYQLAPSIIAANYSCLGKQFEIMKQEGINYLHLDIMDGEFVPTRCMDIPLIKSIRANTDLIFDVHIMTNNVEHVVQDMIDVGVNNITLHYESEIDHVKHIRYIKKSGKRAGIVISPSTKVEEVEAELLKEIDVFQVMSVLPGIGGQKFIPEAIEKIRQVKELKDKLGLTFDIQVDGDINMDNIEDILDAGANILVSGTALFSGDLRANIRMFQEKINEYKLGVAV